MIEDLPHQILAGETIMVQNKSGGYSFKVNLNVSVRQKEILLAGGLLPYTRKKVGENKNVKQRAKM